jgi:hypothetical protein
MHSAPTCSPHGHTLCYSLQDALIRWKQCGAAPPLRAGPITQTLRLRTWSRKNAQRELTAATSGHERFVERPEGCL